MDKFTQIMAKRRAGLSLESAIIEVNEEERQAPVPTTIPVLPDGEQKDDFEIRGILLDEGLDIIEQDYETVVAITDDMTRLENGANTLAQVSMGVEAHVVNELPMSNNALYFADLSIKYAVDGMFDHKLVLPSQESYLDPMEYTLSLEEGIKETLKNFWDGLKAKLKALQTKVRSWYLKVFDATPRLQQQAEALRAKAESANGQPKEKSFEAGGVSKLSINYKVPTPEQLIQGLNDISSISAELLGKSAGSYTELNARMSQLAQETAEAAAKVYKEASPQNGNNAPTGLDSTKQNSLLTDCYNEYDNIIKAVKATNKQQPGKTRFKDQAMEYMATGQLLGSNMLVIAKPVSLEAIKTPDGINTFQRSLGQSIEQIKENVQVQNEDKGQYTTLNAMQIAQVADHIIAICTVVMKYKEVFAAREASQAKIERDLDNVIKTAEGLNATGSRLVRMSCQAAVSVQRKITNGEGAWIRYAMGTAKLAYGYANKSMGMLG